jgi:xanthine dehydrogenase YagS FAD-binding subunit
LDAVVELQGTSSPNARQVPLNEFHLPPGDTPQRETIMQPGEIITAILVPATTAGLRSRYLKVRDRASFEFALVSAAVVLGVADGQVNKARIAMGGVGTKPWRLPAVEAALAGAPAEPATFAAAAAHAAEGTHPLRQNAFKIPLMQRALVRALTIAAA